MGFKQVGALQPRPDVQRPKMRFYSGDHDGKLNHDDLAHVEIPTLPPPPPWSMVDSLLASNHITIALPSREAWLKQLAFVQS
jgi:catechol 2,3-dioxygenase